MLAGDAFSRSVAVAPKRSGKMARPPSPKVNASGGEPTKMSCGVSSGSHRLEGDRLVERDTIELGIVIRGAIEADDTAEHSAVLGARHQLVRDAAVAEAEADLRLVDDRGQLARAQQRHGVHRDRANLGDGQPRRHHRGVVAGSNQHPVAGFDREILDQGVRQTIGPVEQLLVGTPPSVADERDVVTEPLLDHAVGQFDGDIQVRRILKLRPIEQQIGPLVEGRQIVASEGVSVSGWTQGLRALSHVSHLKTAASARRRTRRRRA
jgi:hypothetical protein